MSSSRWLSGKESAYNAGDTEDTGPIPELGRPPGGGHGNPLQYSCQENPMDRGAWQAAVHGVVKSQTRLKPLSMHALCMRECTCTHTHTHTQTPQEVPSIPATTHSHSTQSPRRQHSHRPVSSSLPVPSPIICLQTAVETQISKSPGHACFSPGPGLKIQHSDYCLTGPKI